MRTQSSYLSASEQERIHHDSLRILCEVGVRFHSARARKLLAGHGARVDQDRELVWIGPEMVAQALKTAPRSFTLGARQAAFDFALPSLFTGYTLDGAATFAVDFETGEDLRIRSITVASPVRTLRDVGVSFTGSVTTTQRNSPMNPSPTGGMNPGYRSGGQPEGG